MNRKGINERTNAYTQIKATLAQFEHVHDASLSACIKIRFFLFQFFFFDLSGRNGSDAVRATARDESDEQR